MTVKINTDFFKAYLPKIQENINVGLSDTLCRFLIKLMETTGALHGISVDSEDTWVH